MRKIILILALIFVLTSGVQAGYHPSPTAVHSTFVDYFPTGFVYLHDLVPLYKKLSGQNIDYYNIVKQNKDDRENYYQLDNENIAEDGSYISHAKKWEDLLKKYDPDYEPMFFFGEYGDAIFDTGRENSKGEKITYSVDEGIYEVWLQEFNEREKIYSNSEMKEWLNNQNSIYPDPEIVQSTAEENLKKTWWQELFAKIETFFSEGFRAVGYKPVPKKYCELHKCVFDVKYSGRLQEDYELQQAMKAEFVQEYNLAYVLYRKISDNEKHSQSDMAKFRLIKLAVIKNYYDYEGVDFRQQELLRAKKYAEDVLKNRTLHEDFLSDVARYLHKIDTVELDGFEALNFFSRKVFENSEIKYYDGVLEDFHYFYKREVENLIELYPDESEPYEGEEDYENKLARYKESLLGMNNKNSQFFEEMSPETVNEMLAWILIWQYADTENLEAMKKWYAKYPNEAWLALITRHITVGDKDFNFYAEKVGLIRPDSLTYLFSNYNVAIEYVLVGKISEARKIVSKLEKGMSIKIGSSQENEKYAMISFLKMITSENTTAFFSNSNRYLFDHEAIRIAGNSDPILKRTFMDDFAKRVFVENLSLDEQYRLINAGVFKNNNQLELMRLLVFIKAIFNQRYDVANNLATELILYNPGMAADFNLYLNSTSIEDKRYYGKFLAMRFATVSNFIYDMPNMSEKGRVDPAYDEEKSTWVGPILTPYIPIKKLDEGDRFASSWAYCYSEGDFSQEEKKFLWAIPEEVRKKGQQEYEKIAISDPLKVFGDEVFVRNKTNPNESTMPEALNLLVKISRYGCGPRDSGYSKKAFELLHTKYPNSTWAKKTPYYYN